MKFCVPPLCCDLPASTVRPSQLPPSRPRSGVRTSRRLESNAAPTATYCNSPATHICNILQPNLSLIVIYCSSLENSPTHLNCSFTKSIATKFRRSRSCVSKIHLIIIECAKTLILTTEEWTTLPNIYFTLCGFYTDVTWRWEDIMKMPIQNCFFAYVIP